MTPEPDEGGKVEENEEKKKNQSLKGNIWSAILIVLLSMIVNINY